MAILNKYVQIANVLAQSTELSFEAQGVLYRLLSQPADSNINKSDLINKFCGRDKLNRIFKELQKAGYLYVASVRNPDGKFSDRCWLVSEKPKTVDEFEKMGKECEESNLI